MSLERTERLEINGNLLKSAFEVRGLNIAEVSRELGCGFDIKNAIQRGTISKPILFLLENIYGITLDEISPKCDYLEPGNDEFAPGPAEAVNLRITAEQWDLLQLHIRVAVLEAITTVLEAYERNKSK